MLSAVTLAAGCGKSGSSQTLAERDTMEVTSPEVAVESISVTEVAVTRELAGSVKAAAVSRVSTRLMAQVIEIRVREGDSVTKGDLLALLDGRELEAKVRQAEGGLGQAKAQFELAAVTLERYGKLLEERAISKQEYDQVAAREKVAREAVIQAENAVDEAHTWLAFTEIRSPASGRVVARQIDEGSMAVPGTPLFSIEHEGNYQLVLPVDVSLSDNLREGDSIEVHIKAAGFSGPVEVTEIVPIVDPMSRTFIVKSSLPENGRFRTGQYARAVLSLGTRSAAVVPVSAVVQRGQLDGVYVVGEESGRLTFRIIRRGKEVVPQGYEVLSGLRPGERIVVEGAEEARDGLRVNDTIKERG